MQFWRRAVTPLGLTLKRKPFRPLLETLEDRTTPTTLLSITPSVTPITDANAPGTFSLRLVFNGSMNTNVAPTITFPTAGEDPGASLVPNGTASGFTTTNVANDTFVAVFGSTDQNVNIPNIDVRVSGAVDFGGGGVNAQTLNDIFGINTTNPVVTNLQVSDTQITASDVGSVPFTIQVTYHDQMQTTTNPTIQFSNANVANTLTFQSGAWNGNGTVYTATYHVGGSGNVIPSVNVAVSGAKNLAGFTQLAFSANNVFSINTGTNSNAAFPVGSFMRVVGDFNGDNLDDVAAYYASSGKFLVALSTGTGFLAPVQWSKFSSAVTIKTMLVGDYNHDGKADIAYFYNQGGTATMHVAQSTGSAFVTSNWANDGVFGVTGWTRFLVGDFNNDGFSDIALFQNDSSVARWIVNISTGTSFTVTKWANLATTSVGGWTNAVVGDFNNDGKTDIANFYNKNGIARWYVSLSSGAVFTTTNFGNMPNSGVWNNQMAGDFTGDGKDDIVAYNSTLHQWFVSVSSGTAFTTTSWLSFTPTGSTVQRVGDFNHDGKADLSIVELSTGRSIVALSNGTNFAANVWEILPSTSLSLATELVGDFTGDGKPDLGLFFTNSSTTQWWVSKNNFPTSTFTTTRWR